MDGGDFDFRDVNVELVVGECDKVSFHGGGVRFRLWSGRLGNLKMMSVGSGHSGRRSEGSGRWR